MGQYGANASTVNKLPDSAFACCSNCFWNDLNPVSGMEIKFELTKGRDVPLWEEGPHATWQVLCNFFWRRKWPDNRRTDTDTFILLCAKYGLFHTSAAAAVLFVYLVYMVCGRCTCEFPLLSQNVLTPIVSVPMCSLLLLLIKCINVIIAFIHKSQIICTAWM